MVDLTPKLAEALGVPKEKAPHPYEEQLPDFDRRFVGPNARFEIPLNSRAALGTIAGYLRALAVRFEALKDDPSLSDKHALWEAGHSARLIAKEMKRLEVKTGKKPWNPLI